MAKVGLKWLKLAIFQWKTTFFKSHIKWNIGILDVDNQTVTSCGQDEHHGSPKNVYKYDQKLCNQATY